MIFTTNSKLLQYEIKTNKNTNGPIIKVYSIYLGYFHSDVSLH
jgi:hypothetical protein